MNIHQKLPFIWHGGDYNPEQWTQATWWEDFRLMQQAGITVATVGVFSWVSLQPTEDRFTFEWLDEVLDGLHTHGIKAILATPSAAQPAWMSQAYPHVLRSDEYGRRMAHGGRTNFCPNSSDYRRLSGNIARHLAERYRNHPALLLWHVANEYSGHCYCETCAQKFREWLQIRYGSLERLNACWWTAFWSHTFTDWSQINPPFRGSETLMHGLNVDYFRFMTESQLACYTHERDILRSITPDVPITTNLMGTYKPLDYRRWAREVDVIAWDCYPHAKQATGEIAFVHDTMRGLKDGQPFLLMEQTPSSQNWQDVNAIKRPGVLRLWSYLAVAHGADSVLYFQWRRGRGGCEKLHGAIIEHSGRSDTRLFREVSQLGAELKRLGDAIIGSAYRARVAIVFDWDNWHALEDAIGPVRNKRYLETVNKHYLSFYRRNVAVDVVFPDTDLAKYDLVIAPMMYMLKASLVQNVEMFVRKGGTFVATYLTGYVDETDLVFENGYPGPLAHVLGLWVEEIDALYDDQHNTMILPDGSGTYICSHLADVLHPTTAEVMATYGEDYYQGSPVATRNRYEQGEAYYLGSDPDQAFLDRFYEAILDKHGIQPVLITPSDVEATARYKGEQKILFLLNHNPHPVTVELGTTVQRDLLTNQVCRKSIILEGYGVSILVDEPEGD